MNNLRDPNRVKEYLWGILFILPNFLGFLIFTFLPVIMSFILAFMQWDTLTPPRFIGLLNFLSLLGFHQMEGRIIPNDPLFWKYLYNTIFLMSIIPINMLGSLILAVALNQKIRGMVTFRTIYFLPTICSGVAICILWIWLYTPNYGLINLLIVKIGEILHLPLKGVPWLASTTWAKPALMLMMFWQGVGGVNMILYLAALQGIPQHLYESAMIDGANWWKKFWSITVPMVSPTTFFIFIMSMIGGLQGGFMIAYIMTGGGPVGSTTTIEFYIYNNAYAWFKMGYASAIAWVLFVLIFTVNLINWKYGGKRVTYY